MQGLVYIFIALAALGVGAAAYNYFGKSLAQLTPDEAAFLASLPKGPNNYHPKRHPEAALGRRNWVLGEMNENGFINDAQLATALAREGRVRELTGRAMATIAQVSWAQYSFRLWPSSALRSTVVSGRIASR